MVGGFLEVVLGAAARCETVEGCEADLPTIDPRVWFGAGAATRTGAPGGLLEIGGFFTAPRADIFLCKILMIIENYEIKIFKKNF